MKIVPVSQEHLPTIQKISNEVWPKTFKDILSTDQIKYMMEMMYSTSSLEEQMRNNHQYLLAKDEEEYLGFLSYELNYKGKPCTKVHKIYVLTSAQGKGVGRILIDEAARIARDNGNKELSLNVNRNNKAINFYKKIGLEIVDKEDIDIGNGFLMEDYIMNKKL
jgi:ribosomal protein S18 acetylase RimI-like enzyme